MDKKVLEMAEDTIKFINKSVTASFCIEESEKILRQHNFKKIDEKDHWKLQKGDKFYIIRHNSAMIAGIMGNQSPSQTGFRIIGSHTDSPGFKLKPKSVSKDENYITLGLEVYGGPMFSTWTDRELSLAGKVITTKGNGYNIDLVKFTKPLVRIPQLAIHYNRNANKEFTLNPQNHLKPIMGITTEGSINDDLIKKMIAKQKDIDPSLILSYELELYDLQPGLVGGLNDDFIFARGIDNRSMVYSSLVALLESEATDATRIIALFDNEEVGSSTTNGGNSSFLKDTLFRLSTNNGQYEDYYRAIALSLHISADGAHAIHHAYKEKFDSLNKVYINEGPVIKINASTSYASTAETIAMFTQICKKNNIPFQKFVNRSDIRGGGTIGSMVATNLGLRTIDIGNAMIAMHSVREMCGTKDQYYMTQALTKFLSY